MNARILAPLALSAAMCCASVSEVWAADPAPGAAESHAAPSPLSVDPDLAIWTAVVFVLLVVVLRAFAWKPISEGLQRREENIAKNIAAAEQANEEARRLLAQYEQKLAAAGDEVRAILEEARRDAEHTQQEILAKARADAQAELDRARREIDQATQAAIKELSEHFADQVLAIAAKIVRKELQAQDHEALIGAAVDQLPAMAAAGRN